VASLQKHPSQNLSEGLPAALKCYRYFKKERKLKDDNFISFVFYGKFYGLGDFKVFDNMS
jgi:hypothetical protein